MALGSAPPGLDSRKPIGSQRVSSYAIEATRVCSSSTRYRSPAEVEELAASRETVIALTAGTAVTRRLAER